MHFPNTSRSSSNRRHDALLLAAIAAAKAEGIEIAGAFTPGTSGADPCVLL